MVEKGFVGRNRSARRLAIGLVLFFFGATALAAFLPTFTSEGQTSLSPDGKYCVEVTRINSPFAVNPYRVSLKETDTEKVIKRIDVIPLDGKPNQTLRESEPVVWWDDQGLFADIVLGGEFICRLAVRANK